MSGSWQNSPQEILSMKKKTAALIAKDFDAVFMGHNVSGNLNFPQNCHNLSECLGISCSQGFFRGSDKIPGWKRPEISDTSFKGWRRHHAVRGFHKPTSPDEIQSGPAASVMGALASAPKDKDIIVLDIGGTTTDIAILTSGVFPVLGASRIKIGA